MKRKAWESWARSISTPGKMWSCKTCFVAIDGLRTYCWKCGGSRQFCELPENLVRLVQGWQPMRTAPINSTWIKGKLEDGREVRMHYAEDMSGSEQPPFKGWFEGEGRVGFSAVLPIAWNPDLS